MKTKSVWFSAYPEPSFSSLPLEVRISELSCALDRLIPPLEAIDPICGYFLLMCKMALTEKEEGSDRRC